MLAKELKALVALTQKLVDRGGTADPGVVLVPLGRVELSDRTLSEPPHDYQTASGTSPVAGRVVGLRVSVGGAAQEVNVRHVLVGKDRVARFHGGELSASMFPTTGGPRLAWGAIEAGDPIEVNLTFGPSARYTEGDVVVEATLVVEPALPETVKK